LIIVPTYNEHDNVEDIQRAVFDHYPETDLLYVDDNSPDGTGELLDELSERESRIHVLHRERKMGLGRAYTAGFKWALERSYGFIFEMDADFSHDPAEIPRMRAAAESADLVLGSRYVDGIRVINWPLSRLCLSKGAGVYVRMITGLPFTDPTGGFKCYRREVLEAIDLDAVRSDGYSFQVEMTFNAWMLGFHIVDVPITFEERRSGQSKMSTSIVREALWIVWKLAFKSGFRRRPRSRHPRSVAS